MKNKLSAVKNHISTHRAKYGCAISAIMLVGATVQLVDEWKEFADEYIKPELNADEA